MSNKYRYDQHGWQREPHKMRHLEESGSWLTRIIDFTFKVFLWVMAVGVALVIGHILLQIFTR